MRNTKLFKKVAALAVCAVMALSMAAPAFANDHKDRQYSFIFSRYQDKTSFLRKTDSTPVYVKCQSASAAWYAQVLGGVELDSWAETLGGPVYMQTGTVQHIAVPFSPSYYYGVYGTPTVFDSAAWGYWSPDSL